MTGEEFERMTEIERYEYLRKRQERCLRLLHLGFNVQELKTWDWDHDEGFWVLWEELGLETLYQRVIDLGTIKHRQQRRDWYNSQLIQ